MPVKPLNKVPIIANNFTLNNIGSLLSAAIVRVDNIEHIGAPVVDATAIFLLNPESWNESKSVHWAQNNIPGQSDPVLQWISSGPRVVTFDALVTKDISGIKNNNVKNSSTAQANVFANLAGKVSNVQPGGVVDSANKSNDILNINSYLNYYRSLLYPVYADNGSLKASPPLVVIYAGRSFGGATEVANILDPSGLKMQPIPAIGPKSVVWVVTNLKINITKQLPNLDPLEAIVGFELTQYIINPFQRANFAY